DEELDVINQDLKAQRENAELSGSAPRGLINSNYKYCLVEDPAAPGLYLRRAVISFSIFMGALFGSIMLAIDSGKIKNTRGIFFSLLFGITFTALQVLGAQFANVGSSYTVLCG